MKRIAFVGCAHIHTPSFLKMVRENKEIEPAAVWDHDKDRAAKNAEALHCPAVADRKAIWDDPSVSAVVITSETNLHGELIREAAEAGKHIFAEKPLGFSGEDAKRSAEAIRKAGVLFQTGYFMRGFPTNLFLKQQIEAGAFGKITRMRHSNCHSGSLGGWFDTEWRWMADPSVAGCGAFGDLGTHSLDIILWFLGRPDRVTGQIRTVTGRYGESCDESGEALLAFPSGALATLAGGWVDTQNPVTCEISGTEGHAVVINGSLYFQSSRVKGADGSRPWTDLPAQLPHAFQLYLDAVCGKNVPLIPVQDAADRNIVMASIYDAARDGRWITPEY